MFIYITSLRQNRNIRQFCREKVAIFKKFAATKPRFLRFLPRYCHDFHDFCRDNAAIFGLHYRDKFLPLLFARGFATTSVAPHLKPSHPISRAFG
jgi:hypothetical protein